MAILGFALTEAGWIIRINVTFLISSNLEKKIKRGCLSG